MSADTQALPFTLPSPVSLCGEVRHGKRLGHTLGFPTANICLDSGMQIRHGIYASIAVVDGTSYIAVSNVGTRPTVDGEEANCETHIIDFSGDLYGKCIRVTLVALLREERRFSSVEELGCAISRDVTDAVCYFKNTRF